MTELRYTRNRSAFMRSHRIGGDDGRASIHSRNGHSARETFAAPDQQLKELRRDLSETLDLIERLRASCLSLHGKIDAAEREHKRLVSLV